MDAKTEQLLKEHFKPNSYYQMTVLVDRNKLQDIIQEVEKANIIVAFIGMNNDPMMKTAILVRIEDYEVFEKAISKFKIHHQTKH